MNDTPSTNPAPSQSGSGSFRLFRVAGTDVYIHWSWFLVAFVLLRDRPVQYSSIGWDIAAYVAGFAIVLMHEFGHVLMCRRTGGEANHILLWPLGGLAYVTPAPRPGAHYWTIAAGPLVNIVLAPILILVAYLTAPTPDDPFPTDAFLFFNTIVGYNLVMLVFNLLPLFPLDGGQMLYAAVWWVSGKRAFGLKLAAMIGLVGSLGLAVLAIALQQWWLAIVTAFLAFGARAALRTATLIAPIDSAERREEFECPRCRLAPPRGEFWKCHNCGSAVDTFDPEFPQMCRGCGMYFPETQCPMCGKSSPGSEWHASGP
jgi:Zn-dependent protease